VAIIDLTVINLFIPALSKTKTPLFFVHIISLTSRLRNKAEIRIVMNAKLVYDIPYEKRQRNTTGYIFVALPVWHRNNRAGCA
jgi:hypothetical protein